MRRGYAILRDLGAVFLSLTLFMPAHSHGPGPGIYTCGQLLAASDISTHNEIINEAFRVDENRSRATRLQMLDDLLQNQNFMTALQRGDDTATNTLERIVLTNGDLQFYDQAKKALKKFNGPKIPEVLAQMDQQVPPEGYRKASDFPEDAFQPRVRDLETRKKLSEFFSNNPSLPKANVNRRVWAFMAANSGLSMEAKVNFTRNLFENYRDFQRKNGVRKNNIFVSTVHFGQTHDGSVVFCGHGCHNYYVVTKDGFYSAQGFGSEYMNNRSRVFADWKEEARFLYRAGEEAPLKENGQWKRPF